MAVCWVPWKAGGWEHERVSLQAVKMAVQSVTHWAIDSAGLMAHAMADETAGKLAVWTGAQLAAGKVAATVDWWVPVKAAP
jgi:hypothetical protein